MRFRQFDDAPATDPLVRNLRSLAHQYQSFRVEMVKGYPHNERAVLAVVRREGLEVFRKAGVLWIRGFRREARPPEPVRKTE